MHIARFVKVYRSDKLFGNDHSHKICGNAVEKLAVPTYVAGMLIVMRYSVYMHYFSEDEVYRKSWLLIKTYSTSVFISS